MIQRHQPTLNLVKGLELPARVAGSFSGQGGGIVRKGHPGKRGRIMQKAPFAQFPPPPWMPLLCDLPPLP